MVGLLDMATRHLSLLDTFPGRLSALNTKHAGMTSHLSSPANALDVQTYW